MFKEKPSSQTKPKNKTRQSPINNLHKIVFSNFFHIILNDKLLLKLFYIFSFILSILIPLYLKTPNPYIYTIALLVVLIIIRMTIHLFILYKNIIKPKVIILFISSILILGISYTVYKFTYQPKYFDLCENAKTIQDYYKCDLQSIPGTHVHLDYFIPPTPYESVNFDALIIPNIENNTYSISCYLELKNNGYIIPVCVQFIDLIDTIKNQVKSGKIWGEMISPDHSPDSPDFVLNNSYFSNIAFIYYNSVLPTNRKDFILKLYKDHNIKLELRGLDYAQYRNMQKNKE